jgi:hypothetical protein
MTAARDGLDLGTNGVRWLADITASGKNPLLGTPYSMSRILGGMQFPTVLLLLMETQTARPTEVVTLRQRGARPSPSCAPTSHQIKASLT